MTSGMTIQSFSIRTGLPPSTLRYYEKERLLIPSFRGENGYRLYTPEQIPVAITIHSLRQADVNLSDIRNYIKANDEEKVEWMRKWRKEIDSKMASLRIAWQFLHGIEPEDQHIRLVKWEVPVRLLWYNLSVRKRMNPFKEEIQSKVALLQLNSNARIHEAFVRIEHIEGDEIKGKVGFRFPGRAPIPEILVTGQQTEVEMIETTLFVTLEGITDDEYACFNLMLLLQSFGFEPSGPFMERYELSDLSSYHWMVPVVQASL